MECATDIVTEAENEKRRGRVLQVVHDETQTERAIVEGLLAELKRDYPEATRTLNDLDEAILDLELAAVEAIS